MSEFLSETELLRGGNCLGICSPIAEDGDFRSEESNFDDAGAKWAPGCVASDEEV